MGSDLLGHTPELSESDIAVSFRRRSNADEGDVCISQALGEVRRCSQTARRDSRANDLFKFRLVERRVPCDDVLDLKLVGIDADHAVP